MMAVKAIIFDCFGVLYMPGSEYVAQQLSPELRHTVRDLTKQANYGLISRETYVQAISELTGQPLEELRRVDLRSFVRNDALLAFAQTLRPHYKIGLLSNISAHTMERFFATPERTQLFDDVVISSEVGLIKPYPAIFELAAVRLGVKPEEAVVIDDTEDNCEGAQKTGMQAIHYVDIAATKRQLEKFL